ncbi:phytoene/squalene synthase family protein [Aquimarina agarivorans]|uniref:phytoene/squalene synthase family protein n=1 Tax=Aquimarina agarivorans TaxID=980584 RepID=UPI000248ED33|nr:phytoene/squalene synthase family protein [Aquimarina agarivorans]
MKSLFDSVSYKCSKTVTQSYSTSFSSATKMLAPSIRQDIYNIYGFVRFADEIVDSFHDYSKKMLFDDFERQMYTAINDKISLNPILNSFQETVHKYHIEPELYKAFMKSMRLDLSKKVYLSDDEYKEYIYGSADVVGLMCLRVFVKGNNTQYENLKDSAMRLGSAFQKVNFLRDLKADFEGLDRTYFPNADLKNLNEESKQQIIAEIELDFNEALKGISKLPIEARFGVYTAFLYYQKLLKKLKKTPSAVLKESRIRVPDYQKLSLLAQGYLNYRLNLI